MKVTNPPYVPASATFEIHDVTNAQRLAGTRSDDTTPLVAGDKVRVTDQGDRIEQYLGNVKQASNPLRLVGGLIEDPVAHEPSADLYSITTANGKNKYEVRTALGITYYFTWTGTEWQVNGEESEVFFLSTEDVDYPWEVTTWSEGADFSSGYVMPTVTEAATANNDNWRVIGLNTFELFLYNESAVEPTVNGSVTLTTEEAVSVGWVSEFTNITITSAHYFLAAQVRKINSVNLANPLDVFMSESADKIAVLNAPLRGSVTVNVEADA